MLRQSFPLIAPGQQSLGKVETLVSFRKLLLNLVEPAMHFRQFGAHFVAGAGPSGEAVGNGLGDRSEHFDSRPYERADDR